MTGPQGSPVGRPVAYPATPVTGAPNDQVAGAPGKHAATKDVSGRGVSAPSPRTPEGRRRTRGPGQTGLEGITRELSDRDRRVLELIDRHRFLTTNHIEGLVFTGHASPLSAARSCRRVLRRLERLGLLDRPLRPIGGMYAGSHSSVWMLTSTGRRLRNLEAGRGAIGRIREPGERFVAHYLAIADAHLALLEAARKSLVLLDTVQIEPEAWRSYLGLSGEPLTLKPDLSAVTVPLTNGTPGEFEDHWFIEIDRGTESIPTLLGQCRQYEVYRASGTEQQHGGVFPVVLWVVPDHRRAGNLTGAIARTNGLDPNLYRITTPDEFIATVCGGTP